VSQKQFPPSNYLSVILSSLNRFSNFLHCYKAYKICYETYDINHLTLGMLLHYLGKLKSQTVHFKCTDFNPCMRVTVYAECIYVSTEYLKF